ncbi:MAG: aminotransferase class I/II-fold pyridoxal phosphate-dependent enzyme, partial [Pseudomonadota bacterium]
MNTSGLATLAAGGIVSPFTRLRRLLGDVVPGHERPIDMTVGEPHETVPPFVGDLLKQADGTLTHYPQIRGSGELRDAIASFIERRYGLPTQMLERAREVHPLNGSREGLFFALLPAVGRKPGLERPAVLMPNPYFQAYNGAAHCLNAEPVYLTVDDSTGYLPDLDKLAADEGLLKRTVAFYLCSPANPQGAMASAEYLGRALSLARQYDFMLFCDECYSEIYTGAPPPGGL